MLYIILLNLWIIKTTGAFLEKKSMAILYTHTPPTKWKCKHLELDMSSVFTSVELHACLGFKKRTSCQAILTISPNWFLPTIPAASFLSLWFNCCEELDFWELHANFDFNHCRLAFSGIKYLKIYIMKDWMWVRRLPACVKKQDTLKHYVFMTILWKNKIGKRICEIVGSPNLPLIDF